jgi:hypothetical protein
VSLVANAGLVSLEPFLDLVIVIEELSVVAVLRTYVALLVVGES